jgi:hypothetical protein
LARLDSPETAARVLEGIRDAGGRGCVADYLFDFSPNLASSPPFTDDPKLLRNGLIGVDGRPKPVGAAWPVLSRDASIGLPEAWRFPEVDVELREREPESVARESFESFLR